MSPSTFQASRGLITSRTDGLAIDGIHFYNFGAKARAIQSCSRCEDTDYLVSGGRTTTFKGVSFSNVSRYVLWNVPYTEIFADLDGSLTRPIQDLLGLTSQANAFVTHYHPVLIKNSSCFPIDQQGWLSTTFCTQYLAIRSVLFTNIVPYQYQQIKVIQLNDPYQYLDSQTNTSLYSVQDLFPALSSHDIQFSYCLPFLQGQYYNVHWGTGINFTHLSLGLSRYWSETDAIVLRLNSSGSLSEYLVRKYYTEKLILNQLQRNSLISPTDCSNGEYYFDFEFQYLFVCVSGRNKQIRQWLDLNSSVCINLCPYMLKPGM